MSRPKFTLGIMEPVTPIMVYYDGFKYYYGFDIELYKTFCLDVMSEYPHTASVDNVVSMVVSNKKCLFYKLPEYSTLFYTTDDTVDGGEALERLSDAKTLGYYDAY